MRILYGYSNCTDKKYNEIVSERNVSVLRPDQKYHGLLIKGLERNGAEVRCFSGLPINRAVTSRKLICEKDEQEGNAYFHYITTLNLPVLRQMMIFFGTFFGVMRAEKDEDTYAICDGLNFANAFGMLLAARLRKINVILIVTDLPNVQTKSVVRPWINEQIFKLADGFVFLTEPMNKKLNKKGKPYLILEGHADVESVLKKTRKCTEELTGTKIVLYAGSLHKIYGIHNLIEGFICADIPNCELHIYGDGDFKDEVKIISEQYPIVKYQGIKPNTEIVEKESDASLLVNPRPTNQDFTPYSFPSKNIEYMVSGTPVLTTKLPGMPSEYFPYVYIIENESPKGIAQTLKNVLSLSLETRKEKANSAREFVIEKKSNIFQSKKIILFLKDKLRQ